LVPPARIRAAWPPPYTTSPTCSATESTKHFRNARRRPQLVQSIRASTSPTSPRLSQTPRSARSSLRNVSRFRPVIAFPSCPADVGCDSLNHRAAPSRRGIARKSVRSYQDKGQRAQKTEGMRAQNREVHPTAHPRRPPLALRPLPHSLLRFALCCLPFALS